MTVRPIRLASTASLSLLIACSGSTTSSATGTAPTPAAPAAVAKPFEFAPSIGQYRFTATTTQAMAGQAGGMSTSNSRLMTIAVARSAPDTVTVTMTIDSITASGPMGMPAPGIDKVFGAKFVAKLAPNGTFYSATGPSETENPAAAAMTDDLGRAMPRIKAVLAAGATWADTVTDQVKQQGLDLNREIVTKYAVVGDSIVAGEPGWKLARETTVKATGKGAMRGAEMTLETAATGKGILIVSKRGVLLGGSGEETGTGAATLVANGMQFNFTTTTTTQFTKVK